MRIRTGGQFLVGIVLMIAVFSSSAVKAQAMPSSQKQYEQLIYSVKGADLYRAHCAACHGLNGKGNGTVVVALKVRPPDLTALAKKNGGQFPEARIRALISGNEPSLASHGSGEMPVWGPIFHQIEADQDFGNVRLQNLIKYLESVQQK